MRLEKRADFCTKCKEHYEILCCPFMIRR